MIKRQYQEGDEFKPSVHKECYEKLAARSRELAEARALLESARITFGLIDAQFPADYVVRINELARGEMAKINEFLGDK